MARASADTRFHSVVVILFFRVILFSCRFFVLAIVVMVMAALFQSTFYRRWVSIRWPSREFCNLHRREMELLKITSTFGLRRVIHARLVTLICFAVRNNWSRFAVTPVGRAKCEMRGMWKRHAAARVSLRIVILSVLRHCTGNFDLPNFCAYWNIDSARRFNMKYTQDTRVEIFILY